MRETEVMVVPESPVPSLNRFIDFFSEAVEECKRRELGATREIEIVLQNVENRDVVHVSGKIPSEVRDIIHTTAAHMSSGFAAVAIIFRR